MHRQHIFVRVLESVWDFAKEEGERRQVSRMTPEQVIAQSSQHPD